MKPLTDTSINLFFGEPLLSQIGANAHQSQFKAARKSVRILGVLVILGLFGAQAQAEDAVVTGAAQDTSPPTGLGAASSVPASGSPSTLAPVAAPVAVGQNSITALNVVSANGTTVIKVEMAQPLVNPPTGFTVNTPPRIAFDFANTTNKLGKSVQEFTEGDLRSANIVQAGNRTRLVVNLNQMMVYDTKIDGNNLKIILHNNPVESVANAKGARFAEAKQGVQKHELRDIGFHRGKNGEGRIQVDLSDSGVGIDIRQQGTTLVVDFLKSSMPRNLQRKLDVVDFATPVQGVDTFVQGDNVRMVIEPKGNWEHVAYQTDNKFIVEVKQISVEAEKQAKKGDFSGEKLTLNFQKIDVREALNVIADFTETNMVISDTVSGNITLRLKDVPWDQALDIILQSRGLDMRKNGNVIQVAPREELAAKEKLDLTAHQEISELEQLRTESFQLSYQKADVVAAMLTDARQRMLSKRGSAVVDKRTNLMFVQDTPSHLEDVRKLIKQIDIPIRQVMIEARMVLASDNFNKDLGVRLGYQSADAYKIKGTNAFGNIGANQAMMPNAVGGNVPALTTMPANLPNVNLPAAAAGQLTMLLFNSSVSKLLSVELSALESDSNGKVISSPRVVTSDQTEATIAMGTEIPYLEASSSGAATVAFKNADLSLTVRPQITPDDNVIMDIKANKDKVGTIFSGIPSIDTNKVSTQVLVENGGTVVIGGIYQQEETTTVTKVPLLGDIPLLGVLFRNSNKLDNKSELLIFITPKIIRDSLNLH